MSLQEALWNLHACMRKWEGAATGPAAGSVKPTVSPEHVSEPAVRLKELIELIKAVYPDGAKDAPPAALKQMADIKAKLKGLLSTFSYNEAMRLWWYADANHDMEVSATELATLIYNESDVVQTKSEEEWEQEKKDWGKIAEEMKALKCPKRIWNP